MPKNPSTQSMQKTKKKLNSDRTGKNEADEEECLGRLQDIFDTHPTHTAGETNP